MGVSDLKLFVHNLRQSTLQKMGTKPVFSYCIKRVASVIWFNLMIKNWFGRTENVQTAAALKWWKKTHISSHPLLVKFWLFLPIYKNVLINSIAAFWSINIHSLKYWYYYDFFLPVLFFLISLVCLFLINYINLNQWP